MWHPGLNLTLFLRKGASYKELRFDMPCIWQWESFAGIRCDAATAQRMIQYYERAAARGTEEGWTVCETKARHRVARQMRESNKITDDANSTAPATNNTPLPAWVKINDMRPLTCFVELWGSR